MLPAARLPIWPAIPATSVPRFADFPRVYSTRSTVFFIFIFAWLGGSTAAHECSTPNTILVAGRNVPEEPDC